MHLSSFYISIERLKDHNNEAFAFHDSSCLTLYEEEIKKGTSLQKQWDLFNLFIQVDRIRVGKEYIVLT